MPVSPPLRTDGSRSTEPKNSRPNWAAVRSVPPAPKTSSMEPSGMRIWDMFSTMPRTSTLT